MLTKKEFLIITICSFIAACCWMGIPNGPWVEAHPVTANVVKWASLIPAVYAVVKLIIGLFKK